MFGEESGTFPQEGLVSTGESYWCLICGSNSRNKRKNDNCNVYPSGNKTCVPKTIKVMQRKRIEIGNSYNHSNDSHNRGWIQCSLCKKRSCLKCIIAICWEMERNKDHLIDEWYKEVEAIIYNDVERNDFVGHCCEYKQKIKNNVIDVTTSKLCYDGYLHFPEIALLIPPPLVEWVDIHGFCKENNVEKPGMLHGVIDKITANECFTHNVKPDGKNNSLLMETKAVIRVKDIFGDCSDLSCRVDIYTFMENTCFKHLQHCAPKLEDISHSKVVQDDPNCDDIWVILAKVNKYANNAHLVNIRIKSGISKTTWTEDKSKELYFYIKSLLPCQGLEASR